MHIKKTTIWHEVLILVYYLILSPIIFGVIYPKSITDHAGLIYLDVIMVSFWTIIISLIFIAFLKFFVKK